MLCDINKKVCDKCPIPCLYVKYVCLYFFQNNILWNSSIMLRLRSRRSKYGPAPQSFRICPSGKLRYLFGGALWTFLYLLPLSSLLPCVTVRPSNTALRDTYLRWRSGRIRVAAQPTCETSWFSPPSPLPPPLPLLLFSERTSSPPSRHGTQTATAYDEMRDAPPLPVTTIVFFFFFLALSLLPRLTSHVTAIRSAHFVSHGETRGALSYHTLSLPSLIDMARTHRA